MPPEHTLSRHVEVILAINSTVLVVDASTVQDQVKRADEEALQLVVTSFKMRMVLSDYHKVPLAECLFLQTENFWHFSHRMVAYGSFPRTSRKIWPNSPPIRVLRQFG